MPFSEYFASVWSATGTVLHGSAGSGAEGTLADLLAVAPQLVYIRISNFGQTGPWRDRLASDLKSGDL